MKGNGFEAPGSAASPGAREGSDKVAYLDATLWSKLAAAQSPTELAGFWLELQCSMIDGVARASVYLFDDESTGLAPVAFWPHRGDGPNSLLTVAKRAITEKKGVVAGHVEGSYSADSLCCIAYPFVVDERALGAVVLEISDRGQEQLRELMRALQWGASWIELSLRRQQTSSANHLLSRSGIALDLAGLLLEEDSYSAAAKSLVTELAIRVGCDLVALGVIEKQQVKVVALSHSTEFGNQMNLITSLSRAMQEAADQQIALLYPRPPAGSYQITLAHEDLARLLDDATILTIPLLKQNETIGVLVFERNTGKSFSQESVDLCDALASLVGPILEQKRREDRLILLKVWDALALQARRLFGPDFLGRKIVFASVAALAVLFSLLQGTYRVTGTARIEGQVQRVIVAPFDGYIARQFARAGDRVSQGEVLATLDDRDISLEHTRWVTTRQQRLAEYDQMMAVKDRPGSKIVRAQIEQADAHIALLEEQLKRTQLLAAFDGLILSGDLSQSVGAAVSRGERLFELAPLDSYRVILEVDETEILDVRPGQKGQLKIASLLDSTLSYTVKQVVPITESRDGRNFFRVEALLDDATLSLRPGMEGVGKTEVEEQLLIRIWTRDLFNWLRLKLWAWWP